MERIEPHNETAKETQQSQEKGWWVAAKVVVVFVILPILFVIFLGRLIRWAGE